MWLLLFVFGGYFTIILKINYNNERIKLSQANSELKNQSDKIIVQNEELLASKEALDKTVQKLDSQKKELMVIKDSLEDKVKERTNDLLNLNERLLSQNQQLEQYAYITSHNLRAPVAQIKGLVYLLPKEGNFNAITLEILKRLKDSTKSIEKVFSDLSTILNVKNRMQKAWKDVEVIQEIHRVLASLKSAIDEKKISIIMPEKKSFIIKATRPYVYSILHNLIENAIKYSDVNKSSPKIKVQLSENSESQIVSVTDNGIGIDMELASGKIFQMYQRFNDTHPGHGFGLFLVKSQW